MCSSKWHRNTSEKLSNLSRKQNCVFKIFNCSPQQLCLFCFLFSHFTVGHCVQTNGTTHQPNHTDVRNTLPIHCTAGECYLKISSNQKALENMVEANKALFDDYATTKNSSQGITQEKLEEFMENLGLIKTESHDHDHGSHGGHEGHDHEAHEGHGHEGHDHEGHEGHGHEGHDHGGHEGHEHETMDFSDLADFLFLDDDDNSTDTEGSHSRKRRSEKELPCISSIKDLVRTYFLPRHHEEINLSLGDLVTLMPQILLDMKRPECRITKESSHHDEKKKSSVINVPHSTLNIWLMSCGSVCIISLVSVAGVLLIPLLHHTKLLNYIITFLVAMAVGTLSGDALLHLLPHSFGAHDHSGGGHEGHDHGGEEEEKFFNMIWKGLVACFGIYVFYLIETIMGIVHHKKSCMRKQQSKRTTDSPSPSSSDPEIKGNEESGKPLDVSSSQAPLIKIRCPETNHENHRVIEVEEPIDTGHHHHHTHEVPQTIASLAWMIICGDGLHNITDGLAIGAAFTSGIGPGLGTSLAIFFHEIPQELGDFAILLNAGMKVKQALLWNFLSALMCFVGLVIGLLVGEYISGIVLWILAFTAGGFLYIALTDMLPAMTKQLDHKDCVKRFLIQNLGLISGFGIMLLIAFKEHDFNAMFQ